MHNKQILTKAIEKAVKNGWKLKGLGKDFKIIVWDESIIVNSDSNVFGLEYIIFSHDFAKAFWGEKGLEDLDGRHWDGIHYEWQMHLTQMAVAEDRLKYIEKFL